MTSEEVLWLVWVLEAQTASSPITVLAHLVCPIQLGECSLALAHSVSVLAFVLVSVGARAKNKLLQCNSDLLRVGTSTFLLVVSESSVVDLPAHVDLSPATLHPVLNPVALANEIVSYVHT